VRSRAYHPRLCVTSTRQHAQGINTYALKLQAFLQLRLQAVNTIFFYESCDWWGSLATERLWGWNEDAWWEPSRYSLNRESKNIWIDGVTQNLAKRLMYLKYKFREESNRYESAKRQLYKGRRELDGEDGKKHEVFVARYHNSVAQLLAKSRLGKAL
jgi:hypothetical protein